MLYSCGKHRTEHRRAAGWESFLIDKEEQQYFSCGVALRIEQHRGFEGRW